ncbi:MAG: glycosyltransferase [Bacteroidales bacterium]|nr:glycosyltransferase [Bacteroidales bacterium]
MKKYLIIGDADSAHVVKWVKQLAGYFDVYVIASGTAHEKIWQLVPDENIFELKMDLKEQGGNYQIIKKYRKVKKIIKKIEPDFVNAHYITSYGFLAAMIKRFSSLKFILIQSAWGTDILVTPFKNKLYFWITKFSLNAANLITSDSEYMTQVIRSMSGIKTLTFTFGLENLPEVDLNEKKDWLFYSNRMLSDNYSIEEVIEFFSRVAHDIPEALLIISHDGPNRKKLESRTEESGMSEKTRFMGFVSEEKQADLYKIAQFYISIPTSDATSVSLLEAMAYGCIPIVSDIPANREWIREGENGIFYQKNKTGSHELKIALNNKENFAQANRDIIKEKAIFPDAISKYVDDLQNLKP